MNKEIKADEKKDNGAEDLFHFNPGRANINIGQACLLVLADKLALSIQFQKKFRRHRCIEIGSHRHALKAPRQSFRYGKVVNATTLP